LRFKKKIKKMKESFKLLTVLLIGIISHSTNAQIKVGNNPTTLNSSAVLELESTTQGLLLPRMTTAQRNAISNTATGLVIFNTTTLVTEINVGTATTPNWVAATFPQGTSGQTLRYDGTTWVANSTLFNNGTNVGVGTSTPASSIDIQGSMGLKVTTITSATTLNQTHNVVLCNTGPYTVTLPAVASNAGKVYYIKNIDTNGDDITIDGAGSETIDGSTTYLLDAYKHSVRIICDGSSWHVIEETGELNTQNSFNRVNCDGSIFTWSDVTNSTTGEIWMDRNLGASQVATSSTDANSYGDLYQWGRLKDGHQCRTSISTTTNSFGNVPGHGDYIIEASSPGDWRIPQNTNLWQGVNGINNPCPSGYRLPTETELNAELNSWGTNNNATGAFASALKLPMAGSRHNSSFYFVGSRGYYWSSTVNGTSSRDLHFLNSSVSFLNHERVVGASVRCIKD
jgi:uncharacterized protein (TIGR02145 family)